jgi:hypothetical protein
MIRLGLDRAAKDAEITRYCAEHPIRNTFILSPSKYRFQCSSPCEWVEWAEIIEYKFFYRLLQEIGNDSLVVVNECLRDQDRSCLTYNCIRHFLQQAGHQIVFQYLPIIDTEADWMILFDFDTRSRWKREKWRPEFRSETEIVAAEVPLALREVKVPTDAKTRDAYAKEKRKLIDRIGLKDPHTIPRNLYLMSGKARLGQVVDWQQYVGRNNRFKLPNLQTYRELEYGRNPYTVFEFCHNFIDFADFLALSRQTSLDVLVADLKVDRWYFDRYQQWLGRLRAVYSAIHR